MIINVITKSGKLPEYATINSAGADLRAFLPEGSTMVQSGRRRLIPTGLFIEIPEGYEAQIRPRSGLALKQGITVLNSPGTIDSDYRGEIGVILINHGEELFIINDGDRIAQLVIAPVVQVDFKQSVQLAATSRSEGGFGHTGTN